MWDLGAACTHHQHHPNTASHLPVCLVREQEIPPLSAISLHRILTTCWTTTSNKNVRVFWCCFLFFFFSPKKADISDKSIFLKNSTSSFGHKAEQPLMWYSDRCYHRSYNVVIATCGVIYSRRKDSVPSLDLSVGFRTFQTLLFNHCKRQSWRVWPFLCALIGSGFDAIESWCRAEVQKLLNMRQQGYSSSISATGWSSVQAAKHF